MCAGVVQAGVQFTLFFALLYYLLAAEADPLLYAVRLLPLSDNGRQQAATALSDALRGVFLCALKVPFCHSIFSCFTKLYRRDCGPSLKALLPLYHLELHTIIWLSLWPFSQLKCMHDPATSLPSLPSIGDKGQGFIEHMKA